MSLTFVYGEVVRGAYLLGRYNLTRHRIEGGSIVLPSAI